MTSDIYMAVEGQRLSCSRKPGPLIAGSKGLLRMRFSFDSAWEGYRACAVFGGEAVPVIDGKCMVPDSATDGKYIEVSLVGERDDSRISTGTAKVRQKQ